MRSGDEGGVNGRLTEFDVLRTVALGMILACHFVTVFSLACGRKTWSVFGKTSAVSYEAYLVHMAVLPLVRPLCSNVAAYVGGYLAVTFAFAWLVHRLSCFLFSLAKRSAA